jgi:hypothetical protein
MKTAIEWLEDNIDREMLYREILMVIKQAKEMEKKQIIEFANNFAESDAIYCSGECAIIKDAEQYYNETFKSE